jgi:MFS family permease
VTWRWCFYINLPIGGVVLAVLTFILHTPKSKNTDTIKQQLAKLDPLGTTVFLPGIACLLLALQWGGTTYRWNNARIIALFVLGGVLLGVFLYIQFRVGDGATIPIRIITQRSVAAGAFFSFIVTGSMFVLVYYLPIWFQAIKGESAVKSGVNTIPLVLALVVASIAAGKVTDRTGYYVPQLIASSIMMSTGTGFLTTFKVDTSHQKYIAYQVLYGLGLGLGLQQASMAAQTCLEKKDVTIGVALMFFFQGLGGAIWLSASEVVFTNSLVKNLKGIAGITPELITHTGATDLRTIVLPQYLDAVLVAYNRAIMDTLYIAVGTAAISIIAGLTMEWRNVKGMEQGGPSGPKKVEESRDTGVVSAPAEKTTNSGLISAELTDAETEGKSAKTASGPEATKTESTAAASKE